MDNRIIQNNYLEISPSRASIVKKHLGSNINNKKVIEFGASSGSTLRELKDKYSCHVKAFDIYPINLDFCESLFFNLEDNNFDSIQDDLNTCDLVLFLDVLEHVSNPKKIIKSIFDKNSKIKIFMISPNFASIRMLLGWFKGALPENNSGFFDKTHLKWLSVKWVRNYFLDSKYEVKTFYIYSDKLIIRLIQKIFPSRLCSQFGAVIIHKSNF